MKIRKRLSFLIIFLASLHSVSTLASTRTFTCEYPTYSDQDGNHKNKEKFGLTFLIDSDAEKAYTLGNNGSAEVSIIPNDDGFTLIELTGAGNVMMTVITYEGSSVHSRSGIMFGSIVPSQYYGSCSVK